MSADPRNDQPAPGAARRALRALAAVGGVAVLLGALGWALQSAHWPITKVRIDGELAHTPTEAVERVVTRHTPGAGFFRLDLAALRADLEALPWLRAASLRRIWPGTLDVVVHEHQPAAHWNEAALISVRGVVFRPERRPQLALPRLSGPAGHGPDMLARLQAVDRRLASLDLSVRGLHQDARRAWRIELSNDVILRLGRGEIDGRLARFQAVWPAVLAREADRIAAVDLRYPNGFAVAWQEATPREGGA